jgi:hypothetical protein
VKQYYLLQIFNIILNTEIINTVHGNLAHWLFRIWSSLKCQHDITEILLKVALSTINLSLSHIRKFIVNFTLLEHASSPSVFSGFMLIDNSAFIGFWNYFDSVVFFFVFHILFLVCNGTSLRSHGSWFSLPISVFRVQVWSMTRYTRLNLRRFRCP